MRCASLHLHSNEADDNFTVDKARYRSIIRSNCLFCTALGNCVAQTDRIDQLIKETVPRTNYRCPYYNERLIIVPLCLCFHRRFGVRFVVTQHTANASVFSSHLLRRLIKYRTGNAVYYYDRQCKQYTHHQGCSYRLVMVSSVPSERCRLSGGMMRGFAKYC